MKKLMGRRVLLALMDKLLVLMFFAMLVAALISVPPTRGGR